MTNWFFGVKWVMRINVTGKALPKIKITGKAMRKIDPKWLAEQLGAENVGIRSNPKDFPSVPNLRR